MANNCDEGKVNPVDPYSQDQYHAKHVEWDFAMNPDYKTFQDAKYHANEIKNPELKGYYLRKIAEVFAAFTGLVIFLLFAGITVYSITHVNVFWWVIEFIRINIS